MPICLIMQFAGMKSNTYAAVMDKLGLQSSTPNWPKGIMSHVAGNTNDGFWVVDVWESQQDFDAFMNSRLKPAFDAVGGLPQPRITSFQVYNSYATKR
jgi:hypothetical protein